MSELVNQLQAGQKLCSAIIEQAVMDYKRLVRNGAIRDGQVVPGHRWFTNKIPHSDCQSYRTQRDVQALIDFFGEKGGLKKFLHFAAIEISAIAVRRKLLLYSV
jgi:hypothetical protein